ncbi:MAG: TetR/AcrR family transcriptional regulator [Bacteroidota bacterium]
MRKRDIQKEKLLRQKALKMVAKDGLEGLSMQKLAKAAGISPATIYIYFESKEDLILQLCSEMVTKMSEATLKNFDPNMSFAEGLKVQWMNRAKYCLKYPHQAHFMEQIKHSSYHEKSLQMMEGTFRKSMQEFVINAIVRKELIKVPLEVFWSVAYAPLYNLVRFHNMGKSVGGHKFQFSEAIMLETLNLVLKALKP